MPDLHRPVQVCAVSTLLGVLAVDVLVSREQRVDAVGDHAHQWAKALRVMRLPRRQDEGERATSDIATGVEFGGEAAARSTETVICTPLFAVAACWWAGTEVLSIIWMSPSCAEVMASIIRSQTPAFRQRTKRL